MENAKFSSILPLRGVVKMTSKPIRKVREISNLKDMLEQSSALFADRDAFTL